MGSQARGSHSEGRYRRGTAPCCSGCWIRPGAVVWERPLGPDETEALPETELASEGVWRFELSLERSRGVFVGVGGHYPVMERRWARTTPGAVMPFPWMGLGLVALVSAPARRWGARASGLALSVVGAAIPLAILVAPSYHDRYWDHPLGASVLAVASLLLALGGPLVLGWSVERSGPRRAVRLGGGLATILGLGRAALVVPTATVGLEMGLTRPPYHGDYTLLAGHLLAFLVGALVLGIGGLLLGLGTAPLRPGSGGTPRRSAARERWGQRPGPARTTSDHG